jgi:2-haloacid dehalogenase
LRPTLNFYLLTYAKSSAGSGLNALLPVLAKHDVKPDEGELLQLYAKLEVAEETGAYKNYRAVLKAVMENIGNELGFVTTEAECNALANSVESWPPFGDSIEVLGRLRKRYKLVVLSNIDDDMFQYTSKLLQDQFDEIITAQQMASYKPSRKNFEFALERLGSPKERVLHVAQSLYHDHAPAKKLGFATVRVNRESRCPDVGVSPPTDASPDYEVPDTLSLATVVGV